MKGSRPSRGSARVALLGATAVLIMGLFTVGARVVPGLLGETGPPEPGATAAGGTAVPKRLGVAVPDRTGLAPRTAPLPGPVAEPHSIIVGGLTRTYRTFTPPGPPERWPLLVVLHGRGQSVRSVVDQGDFVTLAQQRRAVVAYLDGIGRSWNAGQGCCGVAAARGAPDVTFIEALVVDAPRLLPVEPARVYLVGYSNGGKLAYSLACSRPTLFAAVATYGSAPLAACPSGHPAVPMMLAVGARDRVLPFTGAPRAHPPLPPNRSALTWLRAQDGCADMPTVSAVGRATVRRWTDCAPGGAVESVVYPGAAHAWPKVTTGPTLAALMWDFLSGYRVQSVPFGQPSPQPAAVPEKR